MWGLHSGLGPVGRSGHFPETMSQEWEIDEFFSKLREAKAEKDLTFADLAEKLGRSELYVAAMYVCTDSPSFYGQAKPDENDLTKLNEALGIDYTQDYLGKHFFPSRGDLDSVPPEDPVMYRLFEAFMVYGRPIKHIINEKVRVV